MDLDGYDHKYVDIKNRINRVADKLGWGRARITGFYWTAHGYHVTVDIEKELSDELRIIGQLWMGSDWMRELINWERQHRTKDWNVLFETKYENGKRVGQEVREADTSRTSEGQK